MILLHTNFGEYLLHNIQRFDFYYKLESENTPMEKWCVYISIDSFTRILFSFETEKDALVFTNLMTEEFANHLTVDRDDEWKVLNLSKLCEKCLERTIERRMDNNAS